MIQPSANFGGSIPDYYDRCLGPAWFDPFAAELAALVPADETGDVLEIACGTGLATRRLRERLPRTRRLVATDLSKAMLDYARAKLAGLEGIEWREADACELPFGDAQFSAVVCAFGVMFVPDKVAAFREIRRVLAPGGLFLFDVWDRIDKVPAAAINAKVLEEFFPGDAQVRFPAPFLMHDHKSLRELLQGTGFGQVHIEDKSIAVGGLSARTIATGQIRGTPRSAVIEQRGVSLDTAIDKVTAALAQAGGADPWRGTASAVFVQARAC
jgi:SAM-dependent methyltransferase